MSTDKLLVHDYPETSVVSGEVDGNIYGVIAAAARALRDDRKPKELVDEMSNRVFASGSYTEALSIIMEYVEFTF